MNKRPWPWIVLLSVALAATALAAPPGPKELAGVWSGAIHTPQGDLRVRVVLTAEPLAGTIDIPQQAALGLPLAGVALEGARVRFKIAGVPGEPAFDGEWKGDAIAGTFTQGGAAMPFDLARGEPAGPRRPQAPKPPFPYEVEDVAVPCGGFALAGTITRPKGDGPFPAVVLLTGSGAQDRNEQVFDHRPFLVIADDLTRAGVLVLRCDDRGVGGSGSTLAGATVTALASDAEACVRLLRKRRDVGAIGLLGHSEGGQVAAAAAARCKDVAFAVLLAGPAVSGRDNLVEQNRRLARASGKPAEQVAWIGERAGALFDAVLARAPEATLRETLRGLVEAQTGGAASAAELDAIVAAELANVRSEAFRDLLAHDASKDLAKLRVPVLALFGERDVQVPADLNQPAAEKAFAAAKNADAKARTLPGLNHLFQKCERGGVEEYEQIEETVNPAALAAIREWIVALARRKSR